LKVLFVSGTQRGTATCRYRCEHFAEVLRSRGDQAEVVYIGQPRVRVAHDVVVLYRVCATTEGRRFAQAARSCGAALVYSTDDIVFDAEAAPPQMGKRFRALAPLHREMMIEADAAIASTEFLAEQMRSVAPETPIFTLRNFLGEQVASLSEAARGLRKEQQEQERVTLGYLSGGPTHDADFAVVAEPLRRILEEHTQAELLIVGPVRLPESLVAREAAGQVRRLPSIAWQELPRLMAEQGICINLAPLELSSRFCHAKSEVKFLEAGAIGIVTVASASKGFQEAIPSRQGNEGCFLLTTQTEWEESLRFLIQQKEVCRERGTDGYRFVHSEGTAAANQKIIWESFDTLARLRPMDRVSADSSRMVNWPFSPRYALKEAMERGKKAWEFVFVK
jgi:hypothetical protein